MEHIISAKGSDTGEDKALIKDADSRSFVQDVLEGSKTRPVLVDFWATWCEPCKQLTPVLEKLVRESKGKIALIKVDIDKNQQIAAQLQIQSVPTVYAFYQGQPVDAFQGALPESQIRSFIDQLITLSGGADEEGKDMNAILDQGFAALAAGDTNLALRIFGGASHAEPDNVRILAGLAQTYLAVGKIEEARALLESVAKEAASDPDIIKARAALDLMDLGRDAGDVAELQDRLAKEPENHALRYDLSLALAGRAQLEEAAEHLIAIISADREWNDNAARTQLLKLFDVAGAADPFTLRWRRRLSSILFS